VLESDLLIVKDGLMFPLSLQRLSATGEIDLGPSWINSGIRNLGALEDYVWHSIRIIYNLTANAIRVVSYECDDVVSPIAAGIGTFPATASTWDPGAYVQLQMGQFPTGAGWDEQIDSLDLEWW
jgi:hypothetical protein